MPESTDKEKNQKGKNVKNNVDKYGIEQARNRNKLIEIADHFLYDRIYNAYKNNYNSYNTYIHYKPIATSYRSRPFMRFFFKG